MKKIWVLSAAVLAALSAPLAEASLNLPNPIEVDAGPLGKIGVQGVASAFGYYQSNYGLKADSGFTKSEGADISNGMAIVQKSTGPIQFYVQAGAYNFPTLSVPFASTGSVTSTDFGALPIAYLKYAPTADFSIEIGKLPTLIGAESGFTYQNFNIQRGLLWNVEPIVSRGVQVNYSAGPISASVSWNDGYYSNRYNWVSGLLSYTIDGSNSVSVYGGGNLGNAGGATTNSYSNANITDGADDSDIYGLIYTYSAGPLTIEPYLQYMYLPAQPQFGITRSSDNWGAAVLANYNINKVYSVGGRIEYLAADGTPSDGSNAGAVTGFGNGAAAWSFTVTPTYQCHDYFLRGELSYVKAVRLAPDSGFGVSGKFDGQFRLMAETGFLF
ncbi:MAG: outer membrane beta-barrel protein [Candidatus Igneacidithiobacillus chanchocoensis]